MTWRDPAWDVVGIDPTPDQRAIRVAYSRKLKTIDAEADPQAFIALREAFERAQMLAQWVGREDEEEDEAFGDEEAELADAGPAVITARFLREGDPLPDPPAAESAPPAPPAGPWAPISSEDAEAHGRALAALIDQGHGRQSTDDEDRQMLEHWRVLLVDPRMQQLSFYADAGEWFARTLAGSAPFSDALVLPVVRHFGWLHDDGSVAQTPAQAIVIDRYRMLEFLTEARRPGSEHHEAWQELVAPAPYGARRGRISIKKVHRLIAAVRNYHPALEGCFDPDRVALWNFRTDDSRYDTKPAQLETRPPKSGLALVLQRIGWPGMLVLIYGGLGLLGFLAGGEHKAPPVSPPTIYAAPPVVEDRDADIQRVLDETGDGTLRWAEVKRANVKLADVLRANWEIARSTGLSRFQYIEKMAPLLDQRFIDGIHRAPHDLIAEYRRITLERAKGMRALSMDKCVGYFTGRATADFDPLLDQRMRKLRSQVLLRTDGTPPDKADDGRFMLGGDVADKAAKRAGLSRAAFDEALENRGTPTAKCNARIALLEVALELPPAKGVALLRDM